MLVQSLAAYADTYLEEQLSNQAFEEKPVRYLIEIDERGQFLKVSELVKEIVTGEGKRQKTIRVPETLVVPKSPVNRNTGIHPLLGCDALQYVLGPALGAWTKEQQQSNHAERHTKFIEFIRTAASKTGAPALQACASFYEHGSQADTARSALAQLKPNSGALVALSVRPADLDWEDPGGPVIERDAVRAFWREHFNRKFAERHAKAGKAVCLISGQLGPIAMTHERIKGLSGLGGQPSGVSLMSFDKEAFRSYGWKQNQNSPVSPERATAYVLALNDLLRKGRHRRGLNPDKVLRTRSDLAGTAFLYWTREPSDDDIMGLVENPSSDQVAELVRSPYTGKTQWEANLDTNAFYLLAVSGNGARLVVRDWFYDSLANIKNNLRDWFKGLSIADVFNDGKTSAPPRLRGDLLRAISPPSLDPDDKVNAQRSVRLVGRALKGQPLGHSILAMALRCLRVASGSDRLAPARVGLVRLCVNDILTREKKGEQIMSESLDPNLDHPAYICGRLLAVYEGLQFQAQRDVNVTVADKYYGLASTYPQLAFPKLENLKTAHLRKLRRDNPGAAVAISRRIHELTDKLVPHGAKYPAQLSLEDQGRFVIGYHHQKAEDQRSIQEAKERKAERAGNTKSGE